MRFFLKVRRGLREEVEVFARLELQIFDVLDCL